MKHNLFIALVIALMTLSLNVGNATAQKKAKANIPFDFIVGDQVLPAGSYFVTPVNRHLIVLGGDTKSVSSIVTTHDDELKNQKTPALVFNRVGHKYFLAEVWFDFNEGLKVPQTSVEKEALRVNNRAKSETVVALR